MSRGAQLGPLPPLPALQLLMRVGEGKRKCFRQKLSQNQFRRLEFLKKARGRFPKKRGRKPPVPSRAVKNAQPPNGVESGAKTFEKSAAQALKAAAGAYQGVGRPRSRLQDEVKPGNILAYAYDPKEIRGISRSAKRNPLTRLKRWRRDRECFSYSSLFPLSHRCFLVSQL